MQSGSLPLDWATANIVPVHKRDDKWLPSNYRPISLTSVVIKVMEQIICNKIIESLSLSKRFSEFQFGFHSICLSHIITLINSSDAQGIKFK